MKYWLVKSEPFKYSWDQFVRDGKTFWDGVRNFQARNNLNAMKIGDQVLFYHSNEGKEIVGYAQVSKLAEQDPSSDDPNWVGVELMPVKSFKKPVTLAFIKKDPLLNQMEMIRLSRLSVVPVTKQEFTYICKIAG